MYNIESHRFQKLDDNLQDEIMVATMALSLLARHCVKPYIYIYIYIYILYIYIFTPHLHKIKMALCITQVINYGINYHARF